MRYQIQKPKNWQDFEELCLRLWRDIWSDPNAHKNGRTGQEQHGVDVYGISSYDGEQHGVQCKGKNDNYGTLLTKGEIRTEAVNADEFIPPLSSFVMATTSPRDVNLQEYCRELNAAKTHGFMVDVWSWDDIEDELQYRKDIVEKCGLPASGQEDEFPQIKMNRITGKDRLQAFFTRPVVKVATAPTMRVLLHNVFYEIMQNAFMHGHATQCMLVYKDDGFVVIDNGTEYNPLNLLSEEGRGGKITLQKLKDVCKGDISFNYEFKILDGTGSNVFSIHVAAERLLKDYHNVVEFFVNQSFQVQNRAEAISLAESQMGSLGVDDLASIIFSDLTPISGLFAYVGTVVKLIGADRTQVSLPKSLAEIESRLKEIVPNVIVR